MTWTVLKSTRQAFSAQYLAVEKELGLNRDKTNVNGGSISIGHPLAASGARLTITLMYELRRNHLKYGAVLLCIGGGKVLLRSSRTWLKLSRQS